MANSPSLFIRIVNSFSNLSSDQPGQFLTTGLTNTPLLVGNSAQNNLYGYNILNPNSVDVFVKFYDTTTPAVGITASSFKVQVPANGSVVLFGTDMIQHFSFAFFIAATTGYLDSDNSAPAINLEAQINYKQ